MLKVKTVAHVGARLVLGSTGSFHILFAKQVIRVASYYMWDTCACLQIGWMGGRHLKKTLLKADVSFIIIQNQDIFLVIVIILSVFFMYTTVRYWQGSLISMMSFEPHIFISREKRQSLHSSLSIMEKTEIYGHKGLTRLPNFISSEWQRKNAD